MIKYLAAAEGPSGCSVSYFFVQAGEARSLSASIILRSLLYQRLQGATISEAMEDRIQHVISSAATSDISALLTDLMPPPSTSYVVIDGLDESEPMERKEVLKALQQVVSDGSNIRLFIAGRSSLKAELERMFPVMERLTLDCEALD